MEDDEEEMKRSRQTDRASEEETVVRALPQSVLSTPFFPRDFTSRSEEENTWEELSKLDREHAASRTRDDDIMASLQQ